MKLPENVSDINPDWLTHVLRSAGTLRNAAVTDAQVEVVGAEAGFMSSVARVLLQYDRREPDAPSSVIVKLQPPSDAPFATNERELHAFEREVLFYRDVGPRAPVRIPKVYATLLEPPHAALVMEDLSFASLGDQVAGLHTEQAILVARAIARLHAQYWDNDALAELAWMPHENRFEVDFAEKWPRFLELFSGLLSAEAIDIGDALCERLPALCAKVNQRPSTIVHQDLRADNLAFLDGADGEEVVILDWQIAVRGMGALDIARLLGGSEPRAERRGHQLEVVRAWYDGLLAGGVHDYAWEEALDDFRLGALMVLSVPVHFCGDPPDPESRLEVLVHTMIRRLYNSALEVNAIEVLF